MKVVRDGRQQAKSLAHKSSPSGVECKIFWGFGYLEISHNLARCLACEKVLLGPKIFLASLGCILFKIWRATTSKTQVVRLGRSPANDWPSVSYAIVLAHQIQAERM